MMEIRGKERNGLHLAKFRLNVFKIAKLYEVS